MSVNDIHAVPYRDTYFVDEAGEPINIVYKSFEFLFPPSPGDWNIERCLDMTKLLGRYAREVNMDATGCEFKIKFNSIKNDTITIRSSVPYQFNKIRGGMKVERIYLHNYGPDDVTVRLYVAG
jgi:hypothetical protein